MPKLQTNFLDLYQRQLNITKFARDYYAVAAIFTGLRKNVKDYESFNKINLDFLAKREKELLAEHVEHDEAGNPIWENENNNNLSIAGRQQHGLKVSYRGQGNLVPVFLDAEHARDFNDEWVRLMNLPCEIIL